MTQGHLLSEEEKEKARERARLWYSKNKNRARENFTKYWARPDIRFKKAEYDRRRRTEKAAHIKAKFDEWYALNRQSVIKRSKSWKKNNPLLAQYSRYRERARLKGFSFDLSREEFEALIQEPCVYCGFPHPLGLDRLDSSKGYTKENSFPCCKVCNYMKLNHQVEEFLFHLKRIITHLEL